jgi:hypothetical protein
MRRIACSLAAGVCALLWGGTAAAQTCATYPNTLTNGTTADANQVMANFNCAALTGKGLFTGNVGISTSTPSALLDLGSAITTIKLALWESGGTGFYGMGVNSGELTLGAGLGSVSATPQMVLTSAGLVGIGTTNPSDLLDVTAPVVFGGAAGERISLS